MNPTTSIEVVNLEEDNTQQQPTRQGDTVVKSSSNTAATCVNSSEEFSVSAQSAEDSTLLQLSNMSIVEENASSSQADVKEGEQQQQQQQPDNTIPLNDVGDDNDNNDTALTSGKVRFSPLATVIREEDIYVEPPKRRKKKSKKTGEATMEDESDREIPASDIWWSPKELETIELNAMYMVKESQQYQEEVICTVLYNKAFLSATHLAESITEDELEARMQNVVDHSNTLEKWTVVGNSRRGLENIVSERVVEEAERARKVVLTLQSELRNLGPALASQGLDASPTQMAEELARKSQDTTRNARIMARMMGQADADALATAEALCAETETDCFNNMMDESMNDYNDDSTSGRDRSPPPGSSRRKSRRASLMKPLKKAMGNVFKRKGSHEVDMKRIRKIQEKRLLEEEPPKRQSEEFRRSFIESLDYGEQ